MLAQWHIYCWVQMVWNSSFVKNVTWQKVSKEREHVAMKQPGERSRHVTSRQRVWYSATSSSIRDFNN